MKPIIEMSVMVRQIKQPPSGGCVLKPIRIRIRIWIRLAAAFRRLCVETDNDDFYLMDITPAAFRRLCVETRPHRWR